MHIVPNMAIDVISIKRAGCYFSWEPLFSKGFTDNRITAAKIKAIPNILSML